MIRRLALLLPLVLFTACVHDITIAPETASLKKVRPVTIHRSVAYYIPKELYDLSVQTPGGNNDTLRYTPYKDTEEALSKVLNNVFTKVTKLESLDETLMKEKGIQFLFVPHIDTMSSSNSNVDWQPTKFNIILKVKVYKGKEELFTSYAEGKGIANFGRYQRDATYAVKIATRSAFLQLQDEIITKRKLFK